VPRSPRSLEQLRDAAAGCTACPLHQDNTQTVFGEGSPRARVVLIGEQPGDQEDKQGHPFVGPAGRVLRAALDAIEELAARPRASQTGDTSVTDRHRSR
jgi:uracil-DNA glycosylase